MILAAPSQTSPAPQKALRRRHLQWMAKSSKTYQVCGQTLPMLPPAGYACYCDDCGTPVYEKKDLQVDELIDFPGSLPAKILEEIEDFWTLGERFEELGFLHCRGFLFYGKQGGGKSSLIHQIIAKVVREGHVAFFCDHPYCLIRCVEKFREVEPDRPILCVFEDIDAIIARYGDSELLQWLDGNHQVNKAINLATTNYPENLDPRIIARPRRFDRVLQIEAPSAEMRGAFFHSKLLDQSPDQRRQWVEQSEGFSFAALAEMVISVYCLNRPLEETVQRLKDQNRCLASSEDDAPQHEHIGFASSA